MSGVTIEQGYFVFTLMPSLYCELNCPHCYLSKEQRRSRERLSVEQLLSICQKVDAYYQGRGLRQKTVICYWYGGEPTTLGESYFTEACEAINGVFAMDKGYSTRHAVLSSLIGVSESWMSLFHRYCSGALQTSYDGAMRGKGYVRKWEKAVKTAQLTGLNVSTISVVNQALLADGASRTLDYLSDLGIEQASFLPYMLNQQNASTGAYLRFAPTMSRYSRFMIELNQRYDERTRAGMHVPVIGQREFILQKSQEDRYGNIAAQTLFLLPNGDLALPDYGDGGYQEFLRPFGNILEQSFAEVLCSAERRAYLRKQLQRAENQECQSCEHTNKCIMEFWKTNRAGDDCFGARRYVTWLTNTEHRGDAMPKRVALLY